MTPQEIEAMFTYHKPTPDQVETYQLIRDIAKDFADAINDLCPESREKSLAFTSLQQTTMWANAAIAIHEVEDADGDVCISREVKGIIAEHLEIPMDDIMDEGRFIEDLGADSLDAVELTMACEDHFGVEISDEQAEACFTVRDLVALIEKAVAEKK
jgi:acyl carrier protein